MAQRFNLACIQITATDDVAGNIAETSRLIREAHAAGAALISTPENTGIMAAKGEETRAAARPEAEHPALLAYRALAAELKTWLHIGSIGCDVLARWPGNTRSSRSISVFNSSCVFARFHRSRGCSVM